MRFAVPRVGAESAVGWGCGASGMCWRAFPLVDRAVCLSDQEVFLVEGLRDFVFPDVKGFVVVKCLTADLPNQCHRCVVLYFGVVDF